MSLGWSGGALPRPALAGSRRAKLALRVCPDTSGRIAEFSEHEADCGETQERQGLSVEALPILGQAAAAVEPRNGALNDPAFRQDHKFTDPIGTFDDFNVEMRQNFCNCFRKFRPFISAVDEQRLQKWKHAEQCRHDESAAIAILDIGRMNNGVEQQAYCVDKNVPLLALDLLARIVPVRINARPPFSALFTLWLSMMAAVGLAFRCARSRHRS